MCSVGNILYAYENVIKTNIVNNKALLKQTIAFPLTCLLSTDRWYRRINTERLSIITYHRVTTRPKDFFHRQWGMFVERRSFERQMDYLLAHYNLISLEDLLAAVRAEAPLPENSVMITFDDGYRDNYLHAFPVLKEKKIPAVLFAASGFIDRQYVPWADRYYMVLRASSLETMQNAMNHAYGKRGGRQAVTNERLFAAFMALVAQDRHELLMELEKKCRISARAYDGLICSWQELRQMNQNGISVEAHTHSHPRLPMLSRDEIKTQLTFSKQRIETQLQKNVTALAFPEGRFDEKVLETLPGSGYSVAFSTIKGTNRMDTIRENRYQLKRSGIGMSDSLDVFRLKVSGIWKAWGPKPE